MTDNTAPERANAVKCALEIVAHSTVRSFGVASCIAQLKDVHPRVMGVTWADLAQVAPELAARVAELQAELAKALATVNKADLAISEYENLLMQQVVKDEFNLALDHLAIKEYRAARAAMQEGGE